MKNLFLTMLCIFCFNINGMEATLELSNYSQNNKSIIGSLDLEIAAIFITSKISIAAILNSKNIHQWKTAIISEEVGSSLSKIKGSEALREIYLKNILILKPKVDKYLKLLNKLFRKDTKKYELNIKFYEKLNKIPDRHAIDFFWKDIKTRKINNISFFEYFEKIKILMSEKNINLKILEKYNINLETLKKLYIDSRQINLIVRNTNQEKLVAGEITVISTLIFIFICASYKLFSESYIIPAIIFFSCAIALTNLIFCYSAPRLHDLLQKQHQKIESPEWFVHYELENILEKILLQEKSEKISLENLEDSVAEYLFNLIEQEKPVEYLNT